MRESPTPIQVGGRRFALSNLQKPLFPGPILKAEVVRYYLRVAPAMLPHVAGRPLSLVRFPDGIDGERFWQKARPRGAPAWIETVAVGEEHDHVLVRDEAALVWLANSAAIELHQGHGRAPHPDRPDYLVWDLDPHPDAPFDHTRGLAVALRSHVEAFGYHVFVKTTGGRGLHLVAPILAREDEAAAFAACKAVAAAFVDSHPADTTLVLGKARRGARTLVDVYRHRGHQTIVCPYSLRGRPGAPASTPLTWPELGTLDDPAELDIDEVPALLDRRPDAWAGLEGFAVPLHTHRDAAPDAGPLSPYARKRRPGATPEPGPAARPGRGDRFVIHRHAASHLHYDLRLEEDGVLRSWAVPRGLPPRPGVKRLAVLVEDHPLDYLTFEGTIPKGQYGGGDVWVFASGTYVAETRAADKRYVRLSSPQLSGRFRLIHTRASEWLLERLDEPPGDWPRAFVRPMLAEAAGALPSRGRWAYELKWDGVRALIAVDEGTITVWARSGRDLTACFPEVQAPAALHTSSAVFDAEIVCLDADGRPDFGRVVARVQRRSSDAAAAARRHPAFAYVFDCLYLDGRPIIDEPWERRRAWWTTALRGDPFRPSPLFDDGAALLEAVRERGLEGLMAKDRVARYTPGRRSTAWRKIKTRHEASVVVLGFTPGRGGRADTLGALHMAEVGDGALEYRGKVGSGLSGPALDALRAALDALPRTGRPLAVPGGPADGTVWVEPHLVADVHFSERTKDGRFRAPVFLRLRPDLSPDALAEGHLDATPP